MRNVDRCDSEFGSQLLRNSRKQVDFCIQAELISHLHTK